VATQTSFQTPTVPYLIADFKYLRAKTIYGCNTAFILRSPSSFKVSELFELN
jgi:hypothetical protein